MRFFTPAEASSFAAIAEQIFPAGDGPGARELGVVEFVDDQLAGSWGAGERMYRSGPFERPAHGGHGWQWRFTPAEAFRYGLAMLDDHASARGGASFAALEPSEQHDVLAALATNDVAEFAQLDAADFFALLRQSVIEGLFSDPVYGGNRNGEGWRFLGFPGTSGGYSSG